MSKDRQFLLVVGTKFIVDELVILICSQKAWFMTNDSQPDIIDCSSSSGTITVSYFSAHIVIVLLSMHAKGRNQPVVSS